MTAKQPPIFMRPRDVYREFGIPEQTLANWRSTGRGPAWTSVSKRMVVYEREQILKWAASRRVEPTHRTTGLEAERRSR